MVCYSRAKVEDFDMINTSFEKVIHCSILEKMGVIL